MGIQGLLQFIKEASEPVNVKKYKGQAVAVDTYCWLHKGAIACAEKLAKGEPTDRYVGFCMKLVNMLLAYGVKPILIFDGCTLPSKKEVERSRRERRQSNLLKGKQLLREGKVSEARECFTRSVNITHAMAHKVIKAARALGVDCLVAPYEADAQLAYLNKAGVVQAVITEDSDLLAFGCKKVILKMDQFGNGLEVDQARLGMCKQLGDVFTEEKFRYMCILSGCDYLASLRGIGLAKACKVLRLANNPDIVKVIKKIGHYLKMNITVPEDYVTGFIRANNTFLYQLVFDPIQRKLVPLNAYRDDVNPETLTYAGRYVDDSLALQIALGNRDINTFEQIDDYSPDTTPAHTRSHSWNDKAHQKSPVASSIWHRNYCPRPEVNAVSHAPQLKKNPSPVGLKQVVSSKGLNLPRKCAVVKRPRNETLSEDDLLSQYSSFTKKAKQTSCRDGTWSNSSEMPAPNPDGGTAHKTDRHTPSRTRNKFATFLQRKNEERSAVVVPGTRSRFFCSSPDLDDFVLKKGSSQSPNEAVVTDKATTSPGAPDCPDTEGQKPAPAGTSGTQSLSSQLPGNASVSPDDKTQSCETSEFMGTVCPSTLTTLRSCFSWSGTLSDFSRTPSPSASSALQQFRRKSEPPTCLPESCVVTDTCHPKSEVPGDQTQPLHEADWPSWSQESIDSPRSLNFSALSQPSIEDLDSEESDCNDKSLDNQEDQNSKQQLPLSSKKDMLVRNKIPGLCRSSSTDSLSTTKIKPLVPARVSGLSKKLGSILKRKHHDAENKPGLQIKISELWKNFGFKKDSEKLASSKKPLSPVKDNIQLTPETEDEIFNKPECVHAQRAIFH
ncbi:exonuclease 1 [Acomys russatus]|uniref:exonuclease 1 n=1 Tax=Acomys russatus TaxID=60746 RepID=UPI0021E2108C|nr:exonuclease 1 [Acomys russatus]